MSKTRDLLLARRREVEAEIDSAVTHLRAELREIDTALAAIAPSTVPAPRSHTHLDIGTANILPTSIKKQAIHVVTESGGMKSGDVRAEVNRRYNRSVTARKMSWYLSQARRDGYLIRDGEIWKPKSKGAPNTEPGAPNGTLGGGGGTPPSN